MPDCIPQNLSCWAWRKAYLVDYAVVRVVAGCYQHHALVLPGAVIIHYASAAIDLVAQCIIHHVLLNDRIRPILPTTKHTKLLMDALTIHDLPDDLLLHVFGLVPDHARRTVVPLVCRQWSGLCHSNASHLYHAHASVSLRAIHPLPCDSIVGWFGRAHPRAMAYQCTCHAKKGRGHLSRPAECMELLTRILSLPGAARCLVRFEAPRLLRRGHLRGRISALGR